MRAAATIQSIKKRPSGILLAIILSILAAGLGVFVAMSDYMTGMLILGGIFAVAGAIFCLAYPVFSFYLTLILSTFISDIGRLTNTEFPLGTVTDLSVLLTFISILLKKLKTRESLWTYCNSPVVYITIVYVAYTTLLIFNPEGHSTVGAFSILRRIFVLHLLFYCSIQIFTDIHIIRQFMKALLVAGLLIAGYACYQEWIGYPAYELNYIWSDTHLVDLYSLGNGNFRKFSFVSDPAVLGMLMAAIALICIVFATNIKFKAKTVLPLIICAILSLLAMSFSGTRTAYFAFVAGIVLYILMTLHNVKTLLFSSVAILSFVFLLFSPIYSNSTLNRIRSTFKFSNEASMHVRDANRQRIQPYLRAHPLGGGIGSTAGASRSGRAYQVKESNHPLANFPSDSGFLRTALETGWIGLIIQCVLFFIVLQQGAHAYYNVSGRGEKTILLVCVVALFCQIISNYAQEAIGALLNGYLFYPLMAIIIRLYPTQQYSFSKPKIQQR